MKERKRGPFMKHRVDYRSTLQLVSARIIISFSALWLFTWV